ncbi:MAG TPA: Fic family protein [Acidimicrobiales bacterium]|nr:Fic family protein [Acidimicrobiales bacterium]
MAEVFVSSSATTKAVGRAVRAGRARKIGPRLYTANLTDSPEDIIRRNRWRIVALLAPGSVIGFRTAIDMVPSQDGTLFLTGSGRHRIDLPALRLRIAKGPGPLTGDTPFMEHLHIASQPRALLESLRPSREGSTVSRGLTHARVEEILERELQAGGETKLNRIRDGARALAPALDAIAEFEILTSMIGTLLGSRQRRVTAPLALARAAGDPYDPARVDRFQTLHAALMTWGVLTRPDVLPTDAEFSIVSFFDAYFSNFIEGTRFELEEAHEIVFEGKIPAARPQDAHDVLGTFSIVGNRAVMSRGVMSFADYGAFEAALLETHAAIMGARPDRRPGMFKTVANVAGQTAFVAPELVGGTLRQGFGTIRGLSEPFQRAAAMMFVLSEVHPFDDGNGRVARAFMNAELISGGQRRILIPSVYRDEYLTGLRVLTRQNHPLPLLRVLDFAQRYTAAVDFSNYDKAVTTLRASNAFDDPSPDLRLRLPPH